MATMTRDEVLQRARDHVGSRGTVRDYPCDCGWDDLPADAGPEFKERFLVRWNDDRAGSPPTCYSLAELQKGDGAQ